MTQIAGFGINPTGSAGATGGTATLGRDFIDTVYTVTDNALLTDVDLLVEDLTVATAVTVKVWRVSGSDYQFVGESQPFTSIVIGQNSLVLDTPISVQVGDLIGFHVEGYAGNDGTKIHTQTVSTTDPNTVYAANDYTSTQPQSNFGASLSGGAVIAYAANGTIVGGSISVDDDDSQKAWSNNGGSNASVTISGSYTGSPTSLQRSVDGGTWTTFESSPSGETWSDTFTLANGAHSISYRFSNDTDVIAAINPVVVGQVVVPAGQSNASARGLNPQTLVPSQSGVSAYLFGNDDKLKVMQDPYDDNTNQVDSVSSDGQAGGSWAVIFANKWLEESDVPLIFIPVAKGGSNITEWSRSESSSTLYGSMKRRIDAVGGVDIMFWQQGEKNASNSVNTSQAGYKNALIQLADDIQSDFGVKTFVIPLHTITASGYDNQVAIRQAQIDAAAESVNIEIGQALTDIDLSNGDGLHFQDDADIQLVGERIYNSFFGTVVVPNQPPVANAGPDQSISAGATCILEGSASSDSDGTIVSYSWRKVSGPTIALANANQAVASFIAPSESTIQTLVFDLTVTDDDGATSAPDTVTVTVAAVPDVADPLDPTLSVISIKSKAGIEDDIPSFGVVSLYQYTDNFILCEVVSKSNTALTPDSFSQAEYRIVDNRGVNVVKLGLGTGIKEADGKFLIHINSGILNSSHKGSLKHQFVVWNQAGYKLPPIFGGTVNIIPVLEPTL